MPVSTVCWRLLGDKQRPQVRLGSAPDRLALKRQAGQKAEMAARAATTVQEAAVLVDRDEAVISALRKRISRLRSGGSEAGPATEETNWGGPNDRQAYVEADQVLAVGEGVGEPSARRELHLGSPFNADTRKRCGSDDNGRNHHVECSGSADSGGGAGRFVAGSHTLATLRGIAGACAEQRRPD